MSLSLFPVRLGLPSADCAPEHDLAKAKICVRHRRFSSASPCHAGRRDARVCRTEARVVGPDGGLGHAKFLPWLPKPQQVGSKRLSSARSPGGCVALHRASRRGSANSYACIAGAASVFRLGEAKTSDVSRSVVGRVQGLADVRASDTRVPCKVTAPSRRSREAVHAGCLHRATLLDDSELLGSFNMNSRGPGWR